MRFRKNGHHHRLIARTANQRFRVYALSCLGSEMNAAMSPPLSPLHTKILVYQINGRREQIKHMDITISVPALTLSFYRRRAVVESSYRYTRWSTIGEAEMIFFHITLISLHDSAQQMSNELLPHNTGWLAP